MTCSRLGLVPSTLIGQPEGVIGKIASFCDWEDISNLGKTSKKLSTFARNIVRKITKETQRDLRHFIHTTQLRLNSETRSQQQNQLNKICSSIPTNFPDLKNLKDCVYTIQDNVIDILKDLSLKELEGLTDIPRPKFCENIFTIAKMYPRIYVTHSDKYVQILEIQNIYKNLLEIKEWEMAIRAAKSISCEYERQDLRDISREGKQIQAFWSICEGLQKVKKWDKAVEAAENIANRSIQGLALYNICNNLRELKDWDTAKRIAGNIADTYYRWLSLCYISRDMVKAEEEHSSEGNQNRKKLKLEN